MCFDRQYEEHAGVEHAGHEKEGEEGEEQRKQGLTGESISLQLKYSPAAGQLSFPHQVIYIPYMVGYL